MQPATSSTTRYVSYSHIYLHPLYQPAHHGQPPTLVAPSNTCTTHSSHQKRHDARIKTAAPNTPDLTKSTNRIPVQRYDIPSHTRLYTYTHETPTYFTTRSFHLVVCLTTGPKPLQNQAFHIVRFRASSFKCKYPLLSLRSSSSSPRFLPRLPVTSIPHFIFPSITRCRRQFLRKMWPIQLAFCFLISCRTFLCSLTLSNTSSFLT